MQEQKIAELEERRLERIREEPRENKILRCQAAGVPLAVDTLSDADLDTAFEATNPFHQFFPHDRWQHSRMESLDGQHIRVPDYDFSNMQWAGCVAEDVGWQLFWKCAASLSRVCVQRALPRLLFWKCAASL